jgi:hypothetical protein
VSVRALLKGVESILRTALSDSTGTFVGVQPDGRPPNGSGQWYYAIHWAGATGDDANPQSIDCLHAVTVTISARMGYAPKDRRGERITLDQELLDRAAAVAESSLIHGSWAVVTAANQLIPGTSQYVAIHGGIATTNGFCETLVLQHYGPVVEMPGEWVGSDQPDKNVLTCACNFGLGRRVQVLYPPA